MTKIPHTLDDLVAEGGTRVTASQPLTLFLKWLGVTLLSTGVIVAFMSPREDLQQQLGSAFYIAEIVSLFFIILTAAVTSVWLCYPDLRQKPKVVFLPLLPVGIFAVLSVYRILHPGMSLVPPPEKVHGVDCALCVTSFAIVPGFWMFYLLRRHATVYPRTAGAVSFLASASIGLLALKIVEANDSVLHLLLWHVSPMVAMACVGGFLGKKYLSW